MPDLVVLTGHLPDEGWQTLERYAVTTFLYDDGDPPAKGLELGRWWPTSKTIVYFDNDAQISDAHVDALLACPHELCSWQFPLHWASGAPWNGKLIPEDDGDGFAGYSPMGLVKLAPSARICWQMPHHWRDCEMAMCACVRGRWHVHGEPTGDEPLKHHHW